MPDCRRSHPRARIFRSAGVNTDPDDSIIMDMRKRSRGNWTDSERIDYYRQMRWQRLMRLAERFVWLGLIILAHYLGIPVG